MVIYSDSMVVFHGIWWDLMGWLIYFPILIGNVIIPIDDHSGWWSGTCFIFPYFPIYWEYSSQLTNIFQRGGSTTNQYKLYDPPIHDFLVSPFNGQQMVSCHGLSHPISCWMVVGRVGGCLRALQWCWFMNLRWHIIFSMTPCKKKSHEHVESNMI